MNKKIVFNLTIENVQKNYANKPGLLLIFLNGKLLIGMHFGICYGAIVTQIEIVISGIVTIPEQLIKYMSDLCVLLNRKLEVQVKHEKIYNSVKHFHTDSKIK